LPNNALVETLFHVHQLLQFAFEQFGNWDAGPLRDNLGDVGLGNFLAQ
jgi:hypothetical protein